MSDVGDAIRDCLDGFDVTAAILFGSFVERTEYRDIDLMVVLDEGDGGEIGGIGEVSGIGGIGQIREELCAIDARIDPTFVTTAIFEENVSLGNPFYLNVLSGEPIIGKGYLEQCRENAGAPSREIIRRYLDHSVHFYERAKVSREYFDCYAACKFLIEHLMLKRGAYVTDPHRYDSYLAESGLPLDAGSRDVISRILMHRRGDAELCEGDVENAIRIVEKMIGWIASGSRMKDRSTQLL